MSILDEIVKSKELDIKILKEKIENIEDTGAHTLSLEVDLLTNNYNKLSNAQVSNLSNQTRVAKEKRASYKLLNPELSSSNSKITKEKFYDYIQAKDSFVVIGEIKRGSPSKGLFAKNLSISNTLDVYIKNGINCVSVLTNNKYFYGSYRDLYEVRSNYDGYILNKEFIIDEIQIDIANRMGANIILLIASALDKERIIELYRYSLSLGLEVIVEVHNESELEHCLSFNPKIIGINNRDLKTFETDISNSIKMISSVDKLTLEKTIFISESGIKNCSDIELLKKSGFSAVLIGESLIKNLDDIRRVLGENK